MGNVGDAQVTVRFIHRVLLKNDASFLCVFLDDILAG